MGYKGGVLRSRWGTILALAWVMTLGACGDDRYPDYRYRMTVEVETPSGVKSGSSVIEVREKEHPSLQDKSGLSTTTSIVGEAVAVDLAPNKTLFALLAKPENVQYAEGVAFAALKPTRTDSGDAEGYRQHLVEMTQVKGKHALPRSHWPLFVWFKDINDPASLVQVTPETMSGIFGPGTRISEVSIEITNDNITYGIEKRFLWWNRYLKKRFDGSSRVLNYPNKPLLHQITVDSFRVGDPDE